MLTVKDLLRMKGNEVFSISPDTSTLEAMRTLADKHVGALLVIDDGRVVGIISERDFVYRVAEDSRLDLHTPVSDYMTTKIYVLAPETSIEECMKTMTDRRIRHLPVFDGERLVGLVSIGDVVKAIISEQSSTIDSLENYIMGTGYGR